MMFFKNKFLDTVLTVLFIGTLPLCLKADKTKEEISLGILVQIEEANSEVQLFQQLNMLSKIEVEELENPMVLLSRLSQVNSLREASLPLKTYFTWQLYILIIKIFHAEIKKGNWVERSVKEKIIADLWLLSIDKENGLHSEIIHYIDCIVAFIEALPESSTLSEEIKSLDGLISRLLEPSNEEIDSLQKLLEDELGDKKYGALTYLILLEMLQVYFLQKHNRKAFSMILSLLKKEGLPLVVRYRLQQVIGSLLRAMVNGDNHYEVYEYIDELLPYFPILLSPLTTWDSFQDQDKSSLSKGLLIQWSLLLPYLTIILNVKNPSNREAHIKIKFQKKGMEVWFKKCKKKFVKLGLLLPPQSDSTPFQVILSHMDYFQTLNLLILACKQDLVWRKYPQILEMTAKKDIQKESEELASSLNQIAKQIKKFHESIQAIEKVQKSQKKTLHLIKTKIESPSTIQSSTLFLSSPWLHPPYIWAITLALLLLLLLSLGFLIRSYKKSKL